MRDPVESPERPDAALTASSQPKGKLKAPPPLTGALIARARLQVDSD